MTYVSEVRFMGKTCSFKRFDLAKEKKPRFMNYAHDSTVNKVQSFFIRVYVLMFPSKTQNMEDKKMTLVPHGLNIKGWINWHNKLYILVE